MRGLIFNITNKKGTVAKLLNIVLLQKNQEKGVKRAASDIEEDGNLSVEEVLTENQEERLRNQLQLKW